MNDKNELNNKFFNKIKTSFTGRKFKSGAYVSIISAVVIALVLLINLIISEFDLKIDLSSNKIYTLTDETKEYIKNMKDDVTIYYMVDTGKEAPVIKKIAEKFDSFSDKITLVEKDPIKYPAFAKEYVDNEVSSNSFIVVNNRTNQAKYVDYSEMLIQQFNAQTLKYYTVGVDAEGRLISAIQYVTNPDLPVIYYTAGHEEKEPGDMFKDTMDRINIQFKSLTTATLEQIPDDCSVLVIYGPKKDFSEDEINMIKEYMAAGGNTVVIMNYQAQDFKNLNSLINYYGLQLEKGIIIEGDSDRYISIYPQYIVPKVQKHDITKNLYNSDRIIVAPNSSGISVMDNVRSSLTREPLLETSEVAYSKVNLNSRTLKKEEGDLDGPFYTGVISSDTYEDVTSRLVVYTSESIFDDSMLSNAGNYYLLVGTMSNLVGKIETISVKPRYIYPEVLNITQKTAIIWAAVVIIVLPVLILAAGIVVVVRRRKR